jgi:hypothetical protein
MLPVTLLWAERLWFWLAQGEGVAALPGAAVVLLPAILVFVGISRVRAALDAYAEREIDRARRRKGPQRVPSVSPRPGALPRRPAYGRRTPRRGEESFPLRAAAVVAARR